MATALFPAGAPDVLYVIDLSSYVLRAYHAISELHSPTGEPTQAVHGTVNMLDLLLRTQKPELIAVALDSGRDTFRRDIYPEYKAHRPPAPPDLKQQMMRCEQVIAARGIAMLKQKGVEADDLIACLVDMARKHRARVVVVAADKDLMQLVGHDVVLWDTLRNKVFGVEEVEERFGVRVDQLGDLLALMGDTSDNIPGVPHVGPKTARDLLNQFGSLSGIYEHLDAIKSKSIRQTLGNHREQAFLSRRLVELKRDCDVVSDLAELRPKPSDIETLRRVYTELGFSRQLNLLSSADSGTPPRGAADKGANEQKASSRPAQLEFAAMKPAPKRRTVVVKEMTELEQLSQKAELSRSLYLETFATEVDRAPRLAGLLLSADAEELFYLPLVQPDLSSPRLLPTERVLEVLDPLFRDPSVKKRAYELKRVRAELRSLGAELVGFDFDVKLAHYLVDPEGNHALVPLVRAENQRELPLRDALLRPARGQKVSALELPIEAASEQLALEVSEVGALYGPLTAKLRDAGLDRLYETMELPLAHLLSDLESAGVLIDSGKLRELGARCDRKLVELEKEAHNLVGRTFNVHSPRQLETVLFDELKLKPIKRTKTSRSTDHETLEALADQSPLARLILEVRGYAKLKGTYIDALPELIRPSTGRLHTRWEQAVTATGRISSTDPNLQNIPIRTELGRDIRAAFVAPPGYRLVSADYSQIELRVLAHLSEDPVLVDSFRSGEDVHTRTAAEVFGVATEQVTREQRARAKAVNFGVIYGQGDTGLAKSLGISRGEAGEFIAAYFRRYQGVQQFMTQTLARAREGEAVMSLFGRRRLVPDISSGNRAKRLAAERIAMNMPIQGTAADLLKLAMLALKKPVTPGTRMILTVHDELVFEVPENEVEEAMPKIKRSMESVFELKVPLLVEVGSGPNWRDAH